MTTDCVRPRTDWMTGLIYPLSALCMMIGCYVLSEQLHLQAGSLAKLFVLVGVLNVYELLLVALGLYLAVRRGVIDDGRLLLGLEVVFLLDAAFLNAECISASLAAGTVINTLIALLAAAKVAAVMRVLRVSVPRSHLAWLAAAFLMLLVLPGILAARSKGVTIGPWAIDAGWWAAAFLLAGHALGSARWRGRRSGCAAVSRPVALMLAMGIYVSLVGHLAALGWVYHVDFQLAFCAPIWLGAALWIERLSPRWAELRNAQFWMGVLAVLFSAIYSDEMGHVAPKLWGIGLSPVRLTLAATVATFGLLAWRTGLWRFALGAAIPLAMGVTSTTLSGAFSQWLEWIGWLFKSVGNSVPETRVTWGIVAIAGAFALLGIGVAVSLRKGDGGERGAAAAEAVSESG